MRHSWFALGIRFNDCIFTEPAPLEQCILPSCAGFLVILVKDARWAPKPFQPLYFGEFGNNEQFTQTELRGWLRSTARMDGLYGATLALPFSTAAQRCALRNELVQAYNPISQREWARPTTQELARKLDAIEVRQHEQNTQIIALLQQLNRIFEPQPVPLRRPIGFPMSDSAEAT